MTDAIDTRLGRRDFLNASVSAALLSALPGAALAAGCPGKAAVLAQVPRMHAANIKRLQDWIALPSIAAENRNYPQGPEHMAQLARDAGFTGVKIMPTSGKPGVFGRIDAGARTTVGIYFMYDVKQFVPEEWSSPPLEAGWCRKRDSVRCAWDAARSTKRVPRTHSSAPSWLSRRPAASCRSTSCWCVKGRRRSPHRTFPRSS